MVAVSCGKIGYLSKKEAIVSTKRVKNKLRGYLCPDCNFWHTTSMTKKQVKEIKRRSRGSW